jgi:hypothetical protein
MMLTGKLAPLRLGEGERPHRGPVAVFGEEGCDFSGSPALCALFTVVVWPMARKASTRSVSLSMGTSESCFEVLAWRPDGLDGLQSGFAKGLNLRGHRAKRYR